MKIFSTIILLFLLASNIVNADTSGVLATNAPGFQASDWSTDGLTLYAAISSSSLCTIYKSTDRGVTFTSWYSFNPGIYCIDSNFGKVISLFIPDRKNGETTDKMFFSVLGGNHLYYCSDISQATPTFTDAIYRSSDSCGGVLSSIDTDSSGNIYVGWYKIESGGADDNIAYLYKSTNRSTFTELHEFAARHIHIVRVNPYNNWLYVIMGEVYGGTTQNRPDSCSIYRSKDGTEASLKKIYDGSLVHSGAYPKYTSIAFLNNTLVLGEDVNGNENGHISTLVDDGTDGTFSITHVYDNGSIYEMYMNGETKCGNTIIFASTMEYDYNENITVHSMSTTDGATFTPLQSLSLPYLAANGYIGEMTTHPDRAGRAVYSLSSTNSYYYDYTVAPTAAPILQGCTTQGQIQVKQ